MAMFLFPDHASSQKTAIFGWLLVTLVRRKEKPATNSPVLLGTFALLFSS